jgi:23S rRNA pseudouridine1911/1915/1917 synthase
MFGAVAVSAGGPARGRNGTIGGGVSASRNRGRRRSEPAPSVAPTLAALVRALVPGISWEQARALCRGGRVRVDGRVATDPASRPAPGCRVEVLPAAARPEGAGERREQTAERREERRRGRAGTRQAERPDAMAAATARRQENEPQRAMAATRELPKEKPAGAGAAVGERREEAPAAEAAGTLAGGKVSLVVYADADVVVVRKPAGILTVPFERRDRDTLLALTRVALRRIERRRPGRGGGAGGPRGGAGAGANPTLRAVQRLDKDTSGLLVFARNVAAQRELQLQLARREVTRRYEALVHGAADAAVYDTWLVEDRGDGLRGSWSPGTSGTPGSGETGAPPPGARRAITRVLVLERLRGATRVACELATGRRHQIRIHLAEAGHPLVGETVYVRDYRGRRLPAPRPMLHAAVLGFRHPRDGRPLRFEEPPPADFAEVWARLRPRNQGR